MLENLNSSVWNESVRYICFVQKKGAKKPGAINWLDDYLLLIYLCTLI